MKHQLSKIKQAELLNKAYEEIQNTKFHSSWALFSEYTEGFYVRKDGKLTEEIKPATKTISNVMFELDHWVPARHTQESKFDFFEQSFQAAASKPSFFVSKQNKVRYQNWSDLNAADESKQFLQSVYDNIAQYGEKARTQAIKEIVHSIELAQQLQLSYKDAAEKVTRLMKQEKAKLVSGLQFKLGERTPIINNNPFDLDFYNSMLQGVGVNRLSFSSIQS